MLGKNSLQVLVVEATIAYIQYIFHGGPNRKCSAALRKCRVWRRTGLRVQYLNLEGFDSEVGCHKASRGMTSEVERLSDVRLYELKGTQNERGEVAVDAGNF